MNGSVPHFHLHTSNRQEALSARWAADLRDHPPGDPFAEETVIVQSLGMRRWLQLELARRNGISAGVRFPFPQKFLGDLLGRIYPGAKDELAAFSRERMEWRIYAWFSSEDAVAFPELLRYFSGAEAGVKKWQLAARMAHLFDQYTAYRHDWLLEWQQPAADDDWQAVLWRYLAEGRVHPAALRFQLLRDLARVDANLLPARLTVFGLATLPPWYLQVLAALSHRLPVDLFVLHPTPEFWADLETAREVERRRKRGKKPLSPGIEWNPLLAAWGKTGRDFFQLLVQTDEVVEQLDFHPPEAGHLLAAVQADLLQPERSPRREITADPGSIQVHACPGPMREVEIFYDQLLALFQRLPGLEPREVLVMTPDLETYAPLIDAVFGAPEKTRIPYSLADGAIGGNDSPGAVLLQILEVAESRFEVSKILALLEVETVRERGGIAATELETLREWLQAAGVRWGLDAAHREAVTGHAFAENSWRAGLDRLLLGFAMGGADETFGGILPAGEIAGSEGELLGRLLDFLERLAVLRERLDRPSRLTEWVIGLRRTLADFFTPEQLASRSAWPLKEALDTLEKTALEETNPVPWAVLRLHLEAALQPDETQLGFLNGGVTFCACRPMRSVPFRVIALLGMNDGGFPRNPQVSSLDRMAAEPRLGDRSLREDDQYLFLETLLSAREVLYLSHTGRSPQDGRERGPSSVVTTLLEYLDEQFAPADGAKWSARLVVKHPLQAFSARYFDGGGLVSFSTENLRAAQSLQREKTEMLPWISAPLPAPEPKAVSPQEFARFFTHPAQIFVTRRLGLKLRQTEEEISDHEPFEAGHLERWQLKDETLGRLVQGQTAAPTAGVLPPGEAGKLAAAKLQRETRAFFEKLEPWLQEAEMKLREVDLAVGELRLLGSLDPRREGGGLHFRPAKAKPKDRIEAWIGHLIANACGIELPTRLVMEDETLTWRPLSQDAARRELEKLAALYLRGQCEPLPVFPKSTAAWMEADDAVRVRKAAFGVWLGNEHSQVDPESTDPFLQLCFGHLDDPFTADFITTGETLYHPMQEALS